MNKSLLISKPIVSSLLLDDNSQDIFICPEESQFYSQCLDRMVFNDGQNFTSIVEFGTGDGSPVINSLLKSQFNGLINGYELNPTACHIAQNIIKRQNLQNKYVIHNENFFDSPSADYVIANPPYIPAMDDDIYMPSLYGGREGADITKQLFTRGIPNAMIMISAYSDPIGTIEYAIEQGYEVEDFMTSPMNFGYYSSEPKVKQQIIELRNQHKAFYSRNIYILAGVLFKKRHSAKQDLSAELIKVMTTL